MDAEKERLPILAEAMLYHFKPRRKAAESEAGASVKSGESRKYFLVIKLYRCIISETRDMSTT